ncbi:MAG: metallophosphoesterase [Comamonas sp.]
MIFYSLILVPIIALWLWWPLHRPARRAFWWALVATMVLGALPALLILAMRQTTLSYQVIAHLQVGSGLVLSAIVLSILLALLRDVAWLLSWKAGWRGLAQGLRQPLWTVTGAGLALLVSAYGVLQALKVPEVRTQEITLPRLPAELDGLRVAVIADIHASPVNNARYVQAIVERTQAAQPDLIVLPGDMVDGDVATQAANIAPLAQLQAPHGVWFAPGNHEYYSGYNAWAKEFRRIGLHYLENRTEKLNIRGRTLAVSGLGDPAYGRLSNQNDNPAVAEGLPPDIAAVQQQAQGADVHLLLAHQPKPARDYAQHGVDLQIAGHTHGGHIRGLDQLLIAPANNGFVRGLYDVGPMQLFVSSGAGLWAGFAVRLGVPSAIDLLVLRSPAASAKP